jgi:hypothetical protein
VKFEEGAGESERVIVEVDLGDDEEATGKGGVENDEMKERMFRRARARPARSRVCQTLKCRRMNLDLWRKRMIQGVEEMARTTTKMRTYLPM